MENEIVHVYLDNKEVVAYRYAPTVFIVTAGAVWNSDQSILTDAAGFRYRRHIRNDDGEWDIHYEYRRI